VIPVKKVTPLPNAACPDCKAKGEVELWDERLRDANGMARIFRFEITCHNCGYLADAPTHITSLIPYTLLTSEWDGESDGSR
jgi:RNA polymerase subunit RPABC4/transcription elongation factor Spt4